jgi:hypothetical protein
MLRERIAEYAAGARSQKDLPFDEDERGAAASEDGGLFSGSELNISEHETGVN